MDMTDNKMYRFLAWFSTAKVKRNIFYFNMVASLYLTAFWVTYYDFVMRLPTWIIFVLVWATISNIYDAQKYWSDNYKL